MYVQLFLLYHKFMLFIRAFMKHQLLLSGNTIHMFFYSFYNLHVIISDVPWMLGWLVGGRSVGRLGCFLYVLPIAQALHIL